jgi:NADPH-dependent ferric siderophore reductase
VAAFSASVAVVIDRPEEAIGRLCRMIERHCLEPESAGLADIRYRFGASEAVITREAGGVGIRLATDSAGTLYFLKETAEAYLAEIDPSCVAALDWSEDGAPAAAPGLREITLRGAADILPGLRRFTFAAEDLAPFTTGGLHVRLLVPPAPGLAPRWPAPGPRGGLIWPAAPDRPAVRAYTLRHVRPASSEIDIDVLMHGPQALAGWASEARPGDRLAMLGPGGGDVPPEGRWLLLGGEASALPALARMLEARPGATGRCIVSAPPEAAQYLACPAGIDLTIVPPGGAADMAEALGAGVPAKDAAPYVWFGGERSAARELRARLRRLPGIGPGDVSVSSYWRQDGVDTRVTDAF